MGALVLLQPLSGLRSRVRVGRCTVYEVGHQKMPVNGWNETRCPNYVPSSLGYALTKSLCLPGSKTPVKRCKQEVHQLECVVLCNKHAQDLHSNNRVATSGRWNSFSSHSFQYICFWLDFLGYSLLYQWLVLVPCLLHDFFWSSKVACFYKLLLCINSLHEGWQRTWISEKPLNKVVSLQMVSFWEMIFFLFPTFFNFQVNLN